jgi:hypothetical protein
MSLYIIFLSSIFIYINQKRRDEEKKNEFEGSIYLLNNSLFFSFKK